MNSTLKLHKPKLLTETLLIVINWVESPFMIIIKKFCPQQLLDAANFIQLCTKSNFIDTTEILQHYVLHVII